MYLGVIRSRPTVYSKVTIQHKQLNRKNIIQNKKYKCQNNTKLIYITYIQWGMLQRTVFINKIRMLQRTVFINKIRMLQRNSLYQ